LAWTGGADFYAKDVRGLLREGATSLKVFLEACAEDGVEPRKHFSGKFSLRVDPSTHEAAAIAAAAHGQSLILTCVQTYRSYPFEPGHGLGSDGVSFEVGESGCQDILDDVQVAEDVVGEALFA